MGRWADGLLMVDVGCYLDTAPDLRGAGAGEGAGAPVDFARLEYVGSSRLGDGHLITSSRKLPELKRITSDPLRKV